MTYGNYVALKPTWMERVIILNNDCFTTKRIECLCKAVHLLDSTDWCEYPDAGQASNGRRVIISVSVFVGNPMALNWLGRFDQWRGDWLDKPKLQLPSLKRLARRSLVATRCLTASPNCVPARASKLTGL